MSNRRAHAFQFLWIVLRFFQRQPELQKLHIRLCEAPLQVVGVGDREIVDLSQYEPPQPNHQPDTEHEGGYRATGLDEGCTTLG